MTDREHDPQLDGTPTDGDHLDEAVPHEIDGERDVDLDDAAETELPPATLDAEERVEVDADPDIALDADRPAP